jgi:UDP-glucuronate 4-epimerase
LSILDSQEGEILRILVTGGAGFIGSHLIENLLGRGDEVVCLDNLNAYYDPKIKWDNLAGCVNHPCFKIVEGDIRDKALVDRLFQDGAFDALVHLAARAGVRASIEQPLLYEEVNVKGTLNLLEASRRFGVGKFVFMSSSSVYGESAEVPFRETDRADRPISPYAATKVAAELECFTTHHLYGLPVVCLRLFTVYGPRQRPDMAIHKFTGMIARGEPVPMFGDGRSQRDYTYISDIIDGIVRAIAFDGAFEIFNLGESRTVELRGLIALIEENLGCKAKIERLPEQPGDVPITFADVGKARKMLGYEPRVGIEEGVRQFVTWWREKEARIDNC